MYVGILILDESVNLGLLLVIFVSPRVQILLLLEHLTLEILMVLAMNTFLLEIEFMV